MTVRNKLGKFQLGKCLGKIQQLAESASPQPVTKARALGNFVEAQVATYEQTHPAFCARLIQVVTSAINEEVAEFYAQRGDHDYA